MIAYWIVALWTVGLLAFIAGGFVKIKMIERELEVLDDDIYNLERNIVVMAMMVLRQQGAKEEIA